MTTYSIHVIGLPPQEIEAETLTALDALRHCKVKGIDRIAAVRIDGRIKDVSTPLDTEAEFEPIFTESKEGLEILRHSMSHVMAMAVKELFPGVKVTIGPASRTGSYYDFDYEGPSRKRIWRRSRRR